MKVEIKREFIIKGYMYCIYINDCYTSMFIRLEDAEKEFEMIIDNLIKSKNTPPEIIKSVEI